MQIVLNGEFMPADQAKIGITEPGVRYGEGCFETLRLHQGRPRFFDEHWQRFALATQTLGIALNASPGTLLEQTIQLAKANSVSDGVARFSCHQKMKGADFVISVTPPRRMPLPDSFRVAISDWPHPGKSPFSAIKHNNYALFRTAHQHARDAGLDECLLTDANGAVIEGTISNFFWVNENHQLCTPSVTSGALPGIIRSKVIELVQTTIQTAPKLAELQRAKEIFLTNSTFEIMPVSEFNRAALSSPGKFTAELIAKFRKAFPEV